MYKRLIVATLIVAFATCALADNKIGFYINTNGGSPSLFGGAEGLNMITGEYSSTRAFASQKRVSPEWIDMTTSASSSGVANYTQSSTDKAVFLIETQAGEEYNNLTDAHPDSSCNGTQADGVKISAQEVYQNVYQQNREIAYPWGWHFDVSTPYGAHDWKMVVNVDGSTIHCAVSEM